MRSYERKTDRQKDFTLTFIFLLKNVIVVCSVMVRQNFPLVLCVSCHFFPPLMFSSVLCLFPCLCFCVCVCLAGCLAVESHSCSCCQSVAAHLLPSSNQDPAVCLPQLFTPVFARVSVCLHGTNAMAIYLVQIIL